MLDALELLVDGPRKVPTVTQENDPVHFFVNVMELSEIIGGISGLGVFKEGSPDVKI
jgi:hypothetical protein